MQPFIFGIILGLFRASIPTAERSPFSPHHFSSRDGLGLSLVTRVEMGVYALMLHVSRTSVSAAVALFLVGGVVGRSDAVYCCVVGSIPTCIGWYFVPLWTEI